MKKFIDTIYFHRSKEDNWEIKKKAKEHNFPEINPMLYIGYEVGMEVEISEDGNCRVLGINGVDVSDKEIYV